MSGAGPRPRAEREHTPSFVEVLRNQATQEQKRNWPVDGSEDEEDPNIEEAIGTWPALALSAAVFGAIHLGNPNATVVGAAAIAIEAGILLSAVYMLTRRLWVAIGLHGAWNFTQGGIFGVPISGKEASAGLLSAEPVGPVLLSGGLFGAEGSIVTVVLGLILGIYFLVRAMQRGRIVQPFWQRKNIAREGEASSKPHC